jgi:hypothetical protein
MAEKTMNSKFGTLALILTTAFALGGCSSFANRFIEEEFYGTKPFGPAGTNSVLPPKLDRVDLFSHIAQGNFCQHYEILTGVKLADVPATPPQPSDWTISTLLGRISGGTAPAPTTAEISTATQRAKALEGNATEESRALRCKAEVERLTSTTTDGNYSVSQRLARAYQVFASNAGSSGDSLKQRRNQIQDEVLRASEQRCNVYKLYLQTIQSNSTFFAGSAATVLGGLGAIFTDAGVARALAGAAGITTGVGAQFQESFFLSIAVPAISEGIDNARQSKYSTISDSRNSDIHTYTLQRALMDAVAYDGACSIPRGLQEVAEAARNVRTPSAFVMTRAIEQFTEARRALNTLTATETPGDVTSSVFGSGSGGLRQSEVEETVLRSPLEGIKAQEMAVRAQESMARATFARAQSEGDASGQTNVKGAAELSQRALANATNRTIAKVSDTGLASAAAQNENVLSSNRAILASRQGTAVQKRDAQIALDLELGKVRSDLLSPLQSAVAPYYSVLEATRTLSTQVKPEDKQATLCALFRALEKVHPGTPAAIAVDGTACAPPQAPAQNSPGANTPSPAPAPANRT